jgi:hypothetical protein
VPTRFHFTHVGLSGLLKDIEKQNVIQPIFKLGTLLPKYMYISLAPDK